MEERAHAHLLLKKAIAARMSGDFRQTLAIASKIRDSFEIGESSSWLLMHLEILETISLAGSGNLKADENRILTATSHLRLAEQEVSFLVQYELSGIYLRLGFFGMALSCAENAARLGFDLNSILSARLNALICKIGRAHV